MSFHTLLPHHGILLCLVFPIRLPLAGAQQPSPPPAENPGLNFHPSPGMLAVLIAAVSFFVAVYSVYMLHCSRTISATGRGSTWGGWPRRAMQQGVDPNVVETFPTLVYSDVKGLMLGKGALECVVCLNEFEDHETLRWIPKCDHVFHPDCIDEWLEYHTTCPVCRTELTPQPGEPAYPVFPPVATMQRNGAAIQVAVQENPDGDVEQDRDTVEQQEPVDANKTPSQSRRHEAGSFRPYRFPRSHSTGHSLVQPGQDTERFTLRLPVEVRKQVMDHAANMAESSRKGNRISTGEGSSRGSRYLRRMDRAFKSDRWVFTRMPSFFMRSSPLASPRMPGNREEGGLVGHLGRTKEAPSKPAHPLV